MNEQKCDRSSSQGESKGFFMGKLCKSSLLEPQGNKLKVPSIICSIGKKSQTSTNPKTSGNHSSAKDCSEIDTVHDGNLTCGSNMIHVARPLLETSLSEVESHYESCSEQDQNLSPLGKHHYYFESEEHNKKSPDKETKYVPHAWIQNIDIFSVPK